MQRACGFYLSLILAALLLASGAARAATPSDDYLKGYADAVLKHATTVKGARAWASRGIIILDTRGLKVADRERLVAEFTKMMNDQAGIEFRLAEKEDRENKLDTGWFPATEIYQAPIADQRWPHFFASLQSFGGDPDVQTAAAVGFGESFGLYRWALGAENGKGGQALVQLGLQFGVFGLFDMAAASYDLINADYFIGPSLSIRDAEKRSAAMLRLYHQSSHLGDEYLLRCQSIRDSRLNVSYEAVNLLLSHTIPLGPEQDVDGERLRFYGGGQYILHRDPKWLQRWSGQAGSDYVGAKIWPSLRSALGRNNLETRFVAGLDLQSHEQVDWDPDISLRAGLQFGESQNSGRNLRLMAEFYHGHSPHGQFFQREIE